MFIDKYLILCKKKGVSPSFAATEAGISKSLVTKWKNNKTEVPSPEVLQKLSAYFGISVSELLDEKKEKPPVEDKGLNLDNISETQRFIIETVLKMPEDRQNALAEFLGLAE